MMWIILDDNENNGYRRDCNIFHAAEIMKGDYKGKFACSVNALNEFPELFEGVEMGVPVMLSPEDFKTDENEHE